MVKILRRILLIVPISLILLAAEVPAALAQDSQPFDTTLVPIMNATITTPANDARLGLDSALSQLLDVYEEQGLGAAQGYGDQHAMVMEEDQVQVVLVGEREANMAAIRAAVTETGGRLESSYENFQQAMAPIGVLEALTGRFDVKLVRVPRRPIPLEPAIGALTSEGVAASLASSWHSNAVPRRGEGMKVAIVDGGFSGYAGLLGVDLPAAVITRDYTADFPGTSPHGTACAEIVYDMAYGVNSMYLVKIGTDVDLANAITYLTGQGVHVISMSLGWIAAGPGDGSDGGGSSPLYDALANARSNGVFVATAAGNNRDDMWHGTYSDDLSQPGTHRWAHGSNVNCIGVGGIGCYSIGAGTAIRASLHWDSWPGGPEDYDLYLLRWTGSAWATVDSSTNRQTVGAEPVESISYVTVASASPYGFLVADYSTSGAGCFRLILSHSLGGSLYDQVESHTLIFPSDSPDAMAVAAVDVSSYAQESYSSEGPTFGSGGACSGGSTEPDIAGYANVSTVSYGVGMFNGTSAATPHVAGAAVLYTGAYSATIGGGSPPSPAQTQSYLENSAIDLLAAGRDNETGEGRLALGGLSPTAITGRDMTAQSRPFSGPAPVALLAAALLTVLAAGASWWARRRKT